MSKGRSGHLDFSVRVLTTPAFTVSWLLRFIRHWPEALLVLGLPCPTVRLPKLPPPLVPPHLGYTLSTHHILRIVTYVRNEVSHLSRIGDRDESNCVWSLRTDEEIKFEDIISFMPHYTSGYTNLVLRLPSFRRRISLSLLSCMCWICLYRNQWNS